MGLAEAEISGLSSRERERETGRERGGGIENNEDNYIIGIARGFRHSR